MNRFPGCERRVFLWLKRGRVAHLLAKRRVSTGPISHCGRFGGTEMGWRDAKAFKSVCSVCARLAGVQLEAA